jgi:tRNA pseudouridine65 synthase
MQNSDIKETLEILYQDEYLIAVNKPSGLLVHKSPIDKHETRFALQIVRDQIGQYVYPIHRLDKPTSGVLIFALNQTIANQLSEMFANGTIEKNYIAITRGYTPQSGLIDHPLTQMLDTQKQKKQKKRYLEKEAKEAQTYFQTLATISLTYCVDKYPTTRYSLVQLNPKTGRKHQLRRHLKHISHHIVGDTKHGRGEHNKFFRKEFNIHRLLLHAFKIKFIHPVLNKEITIDAGVDENFTKLFELFDWDVEFKSDVFA